MEDDIDDLVRRLVKLENELEAKLEARRARFEYRLERKRVVFADAVIQRHTRLKTGVLTFLRKSPLAALIVAPAVYSVIVPTVLLDFGITVFQYICFSAWGIKRVDRGQYVVVDRHRLAYLNGIEKLNCAYCGYVNGVFAYAAEAASRTEQYWCPIKHALRVRGSHRRYRGFVEYGDADGYRRRLAALRAEVKSGETRKETPPPSDKQTE